MYASQHEPLMLLVCCFCYASRIVRCLWCGHCPSFSILDIMYWLQNENVFIRGCYFQEGSDVKMDMKVDTAYERSLQTVLDWVSREVNSNKTQVFFRTYAPVHFRLVWSFFVLVNLFLVLKSLHISYLY